MSKAREITSLNNMDDISFWYILSGILCDYRPWDCPLHLLSLLCICSLSHWSERLGHPWLLCTRPIDFNYSPMIRHSWLENPLGNVQYLYFLTGKGGFQPAIMLLYRNGTSKWTYKIGTKGAKEIFYSLRKQRICIKGWNTALLGPTVFLRSRRGSGWSPVVFRMRSLLGP